MTGAGSAGKAGKMKHIDGKYLVNQRIAIIRPDTSLCDPEYLFQFVSQEKLEKMLRRMALMGGGQPNISGDDIRSIQVPLPLISVQRQISNNLAVIDRIVYNTNSSIRFLRNTKTGLMQCLLTRGIGHTKFTKTKIGQIPKEWTITKLGDTVSFKNGINFGSSQKGNSGILTLDVKNMYSDNLEPNLDSLYRVDKRVNQEMLLEDGDVLIVRSSVKKEGVGWATCFQEYVEPVTYCGFIIRARVTSDEILPQFLTYVLRSSSCRRQIIRRSGQVAITNISQTSLSDVHIPLPPQNEQKRIIDSLKSIDLAISLEKENKTNLDELKKGLMQVLLAGKVHVKG
jgi:type I restriction enzyme S subunit